MTSLHQFVYNPQMHPGDVSYLVMTPKDFQAYVAWLQVRPLPYEGGEASYTVEEEVEAEGDGGDPEGDEQGDERPVFSANSTRSGSVIDGGQDDMVEN